MILLLLPWIFLKLTSGAFGTNSYVPSAFGSLSESQCSTQTSCDECYGSSLLCHWCKNIPPPVSHFTDQTGSCHDKLSPYGCQVGDACSADDCGGRTSCSACKLGGCKWCAAIASCVSPYSWACALPSNCLPNEECKRVAPEFMGYQNAIPKWVIWSMAVSYFLIVTLSVFVIYMWYPFVFGPVTNLETEQLVSTSPPVNRTRRVIFKLGVFLWSLVVLAIGAIMLLAGIYWPSPPDVSMCNVDLMWGDTLNMIIKTVTSGKTTVESEILITIYNPNRVGLTLNSVNGNIYYKASPIGFLELESIPVLPGSAMDGLGVVEFSGFENIADILYDFNVKHKLVMNFELVVNFTVSGHTLSTAVPRFELNVNDPPPQKYCHCVNDTPPAIYTQ